MNPHIWKSFVGVQSRLDREDRLSFVSGDLYDLEKDSEMANSMAEARRITDKGQKDREGINSHQTKAKQSAFFSLKRAT